MPATTKSATKRPRLAPEVEVYDQALEAHRLRVAGLGWAEVAKQSGYVTAGVALMAVTAYLQKAALSLAPEVRRAALQTDLDRLDAVHAAFWPRVLEGDVAAAGVVFKAIDRRARLLGYDGLEDGSVQPPRSIVIGGGPDMADQLKAAVLAGQATDRTQIR